MVFSGRAAAVALHGFGDQCQAETAVFFAVQGVVALEEARQGVIRNGRYGAVMQAEADVAPGLCGGKSEGAAIRGSMDSVIQQVGKALFQPERVGTEGERWEVCAKAEVFLCESRLLGVSKFLPKWGDIDRLFVERGFFEAREFEQAAYKFVQAVALLGDICRKVGTVSSGQFVLQQFGAGGDGGERTFQLVGEGFDVAGDVVAVFEFAPHVADGVRQAVQFGGEVEARRGRDGGMRGGVAADEVDAAPYPQGKQGDEGEAGSEVERTAAAQFALALCLVGLDIGAGFAEADDTEQLPVAVADGRGDVHGAAIRAVAAARAIFTAQCSQDVVPAAVVLAYFCCVAVVKDDTVCIGDDELLVVSRFVILIDMDAARAGKVSAQGGLPGGIVNIAVF